MRTAVPPVRNTASWSGTAYSSRQAWLISQLTLISGGHGSVRHSGTCRVGDVLPTATPILLLLLFLLLLPPRWSSGKASASRACAGIFSGSSHTSDLKIGTPVATLPGAWRYRVSTGTGRPGVSILWLGEVERLICNFYLNVAAQFVWADPSLRYTGLLLGR